MNASALLVPAVLVPAVLVPAVLVLAALLGALLWRLRRAERDALARAGAASALRADAQRLAARLAPRTAPLLAAPPTTRPAERPDPPFREAGDAPRRARPRRRAAAEPAPPSAC